MSDNRNYTLIKIALGSLVVDDIFKVSLSNYFHNWDIMIFLLSFLRWLISLKNQLLFWDEELLRCKTTFLLLTGLVKTLHKNLLRFFTIYLVHKTIVIETLQINYTRNIFSVVPISFQICNCNWFLI